MHNKGELLRLTNSNGGVFVQLLQPVGAVYTVVAYVSTGAGSAVEQVSIELSVAVIREQIESLL